MTSPALQKLMDLLFPPRCLVCGAAGEPLCQSCRKGLRAVEERACPFCGRGKALCRCDYGKDFLFERTVSQWYYTESGAALIQNFKFKARKNAYDLVLGPAFESRVLREYGGLGADYIVPVPMYRGEARRRGFCHAEYIARSLGKAMGIPVREGLLLQSRKKLPQHSLKGKARAENVRGIYQTSDRADGDCVLLVDDIATSFATLGECAGALRSAGADRVLCAVPMTAAPLVREAHPQE